MKRMKRWISLVLALSLMLSACPVSVYAEIGETEAAAVETTAATEAVTEPPETTEAVTEPVVTTEATEPEQTTVSTEPTETTVVTEPVEETTEATEPATEPSKPEPPTEPAETTAKLESVEITASQEAALAASTVASGSCGASLHWKLDGDGVLTISGRGNMWAYNPDKPAPWYAYRSSIKSLVLEEGITSIGSFAFNNCPNVTGELRVPDTVKLVESCAFRYMTGLTSIVFGENLAELGSGYGNYGQVFGNSAITEITFTGTGQIACYNNPFSYASSLKKIKVPAEAYSSYADTLRDVIPSAARIVCFDWEEDLLIQDNVLVAYLGEGTEVTIPDTVTAIEAYAFYKNKKLTKVVLGSGVERIGDYAFYQCSYLTGTLEIPDSVKTIGEKAFYECKKVTGLTLGSSLETIGPYAFYYCNGMTGTLTIPDSVTAISDCAFFSCTSLTGLQLGSSLEVIGNSVFSLCNSLTGTLVIPDSVTTIGNAAFGSCTNLTGLELGNSLKTIGVQAFGYCSKLAGTLVIPDSVVYIGNYAFEGQNKLTGLALGSGLKTIGNRSFFDCNSLTGTLTIPDSVISIGEYAFSSCEGLTGLILGNSLTTIEEYAFSECSGFTGNLYIPDSVTTIGEYAFYKCSGFTGTLDLPENLDTVNWYAFYGCSGFTGALVIPNSVTTIGEYAFYNCSGFTGTLDLPENLNTVNQYAFYGCSGFTGALVIPDAVTKLSQSCFYGLKEITSVTLGSSLTSIVGSFGGCSGITEMTFTGLKVPKLSSNLSNLTNLKTVYVPAGALAAYKSSLSGSLPADARIIPFGEGADLLADFLIEDGVLVAYLGENSQVVITPEMGVTAIGPGAFQNRTDILSVTIPDTVTTIGNYAFDGCTGLTAAELPDTVTSIGNYAFRNCVGLTGDLKISDFVKTLGAGAYYGCSGFNGELILPEGITSISNYTFYNCTGLTGTLTLPSSVTSIGNYAFYKCSGFTGTLDLSEKITSIGTGAFYGCKGFTGELVIPTSVTTISSSAFSGCSGFQGTLRLPNSITSVGSSAFSNCTGFTGDLVIPDLVATINDSAFSGCTGFDGMLTFPAGITTIGNYAFSGCSSITVMNFLSAAVPSMGTYSFRNMTALRRIFVHPESYDSYAYTFRKLLGYTVSVFADYMNMQVKNLHVTRLYSKTAVLEWDPHMSEDVVGYTVSRDGVTVGTTETCRFIDRNLTLGQSYTYSVQGYSAEGDTTPAAEITLTTQSPKAYDLKTANGTTKVNESSNTLLGYVSHNYSLQPLDQLCNSGTFYYELDGQRTLMGEAVLNEELSEEKTLVYTMDWALEDLEEGAYTVVFYAADPDGTASEYSTTITIDRSVPQKIASVVAVDNVDRIHVNWAIAAELDTTVYRIYRRAAEETEFQRIAQIDNRNTLTYADTDVRTDGVYFYYVVGVNPLGQEGEPSEIAGATLMPDTSEPVVNQLTPANGSWLTGTKTITLQAEDNVQVVRAELHYSVDAGETWVLLAELTPGNWKTQLDTTTLEDGILRVKVIAWDAAGNASRELIYDYAVDNTGPEQVKNLSYSSTNVTATLHWSDVADKDLSYFRVERKMSSGLYQKMSDVTGTLGANLYNLTPGTEYTYRVVAYDRYGNRGVPSEDITVLTKSDFTPPVITAIHPAHGYYTQEIPVEVIASDEYCVASITLQTSTDRISWQDVYTQEFTAPSRTRYLNHTLALDAYSEGTLYVRAVAWDAGGNESDIGINAPFVQYIVDRTAPAAPEAVTAKGGCGYVEISWEQGSEEDLNTYSIYRADSSGGAYTRIASDLKTVNYYDRSVQEETVYYYKLQVQDLAGNESAFSQVVTASSMPDTERPKILAIYPTSGSAIGPGNCEISVAASDNNSLDSVKIEYSTNEQNYVTLCELKKLVSYGNYAAAKLPVNNFADGQTIYVRASATDKAGNASGAFSATYTVDAAAPGIWSASAAFDTDHVLVTWTGKNEPDLSNYQIYREEDGTYSRIGYVPAESGKREYSFRDTGISAASNLYTYKVEAVDRCGNASWVVTEAVEVADRQFPRAVISCDNTMQAGVEYLIDASGSSDNTGIATWFFDFGDGTTGTEAKAAHCYEETGTYTITLTVTDLEGNQNTVTKTITVVDRALLGTIKVLVRDEYGTAVPGASVYLDLGEENQAMKKTDGEGYALFTAQVGTHTLGCIIPDNQWLPAKKDAVVTAGAETAVTMTMVHQPLIQGEFEVNRMTFEEIEAAGIDVQDPANQHMVRVNVALSYGESQKINTSFVFNMTTKESPDTNIRLDIDNDGESDREFVPVILGGEDEEQISVAYLDLPIGTSFLKEFFDVNLHIINNASSDFSMTDNVITLNVPDGMSLVPAAGKEDHALVKVPEIPGQTSKTVSWILRGDQEGTYQLSANYSGILSAFDEPIYATFLAKEPLKVYGLSAVKLIAELNSTITNDAFHFNLALENVSDIDVNMPSVEVLEHVLNTYLTQEPAKEEEETQPEIWNPEVRHLNTILRNTSGNRQHIGTEAEVTTLRPDERLTKQYAVYNVVGFNNVLHLRNAIARIADSVGLKVEIIETDMDLYNTEDAAQKLAALSGDKKALYDYILRNDQFFYVMESVHRDRNILDSIGLNSFGSAREKMNISSYDDEARSITRKFVAQLLLDASMQEAIADRAESKYLEVAAAGIQSIHGFLNDAEGAAAEAARTGLTEFLRQANTLQKLAASLKNTGYQGFTQDLLDRLEADGMAADALDLIHRHCESKTMAADMEAVFQAAYEETDTVLEKIGDLLENWYDSATLLRDMAAISAAYEESNLLLEMLETNLDSSSPAVQEIRAIRSSLESVKNSQIAGFLDQMGGAEATPETVKKYLDASFGANVGVGYTLAKLVFGEAYDALTWNGFSDGRHVLQLNTELSFAMTDAVLHHGLGADSQEEAVYTLRALKYLIKLRMLGEQNYVNYCSSMSDADQAEHLSWVNQNMGAAYDSLQDYASDILALLSEYRDTIFTTYYTRLDIPEAPQVTIDYLHSATKETFSAVYEYRFGDTQWVTCTGTAIPIQPGTVPKSLQVRQKETSSSFAGNATRIVIPAMPRLTGDISVSRTGGTYQITGLEAGSYRYGFANEASLENLSSTLTVADDQTVTLTETGAWVYLALRSEATETAFASQIRYLAVEVLSDSITGTCGDNVTWVLDGEGTLTISGQGDMDYYSDETEQPWYEYRTAIMSIVIENGITRIGNSAFAGIATLSAVTIPGSVRYIEFRAFADCTDLVSVIIPEGVRSIGSAAFEGCTSLTSVSIPSGVTCIDNYTFYQCVSLTNVTIPEGLKKINQSAFSHCSSLTGVTIPDGVTIIDQFAFSGCASLTTITIPDSVTELGIHAFDCCTGLTSVTIGNGITMIYGSVFDECTSLTSVTIPRGVTSIGAFAFGECTALTSVVIPDSVTEIGMNAFYKCTSLASVTIPDSVTHIGMGAFYYCTGLTTVTLGSGVTNIGEEAFEECTGLTNVVIPGSVTSFGSFAFSDCTGLTSVVMLEGVTSIGKSAFSDCTALTNVVIPDSVTSIGRYAFSDCTSLNNVVIPGSVSRIDDYVFYRCGNLTDITILNGVTEIGSYAFYVCTSLTDVTMPASVSRIEQHAFDYCRALRTITFEGDVPFFDTSVFATVTATARYPAGNSTWTEDKLQNYGGTLTWEPYCSAENSITLDMEDLSGETSVWIDGVEYPVQTAGDLCYVELPDGNAKTMVSYTYHTEDASDPHSRYPVGMKVWILTEEDGKYTAVRQADFDDILQYSGMSIRVTGKQGIRMITSVDLDKKNSLISENLAGYTLKEYGTVVAWASRLTDQPLVLGKPYSMSAYAYRKGIADPVFAYDGDRMQYTNVLVGFREDQCGDDLAMRPYMILADAAGNEVTLYGGIVHRSIGYIAYQNRNSFAAGTDAYQYVWDIIHNVYGDLYDEEYAA